MRPLFIGLMALVSGFANASPVQVVHRVSLSEVQSTKVLHWTERFAFQKSKGASEEDFRNLYFINLEDSLYDYFSLLPFGKIVAYEAGEFALLKLNDREREALAAFLHDDRWSCGQLFRLFGDEVDLAAASPALPVIALDQKLEAVQTFLQGIEPEAIRKEVESLVALGTRYAKSPNASATTELLAEKYRVLAAGRRDVSIEQLAHPGQKQNSLVVRVLGATRPDEVIVLGSHIDSINRVGGNEAPGADDNASGTASHLHFFARMMAEGWRLDRTLEIHGYAAEELGLIGSQDIAARYKKAGTKVVAMMQQDMNLFRGGEFDMIWLISNDTDPQLTKDSMQLIKNYQIAPVDSNRLTAGTSDHRAWTRQGIPTVFPTENPSRFNRSIHTANDTIANSGAFTQAAQFVGFTASFVAHFAGLNQEPQP